MSKKQEKLKLEAVASEETNVDKYEFEPIQGYPMLNWRGKRPFRSTQYFPAQLKETFGKELDGWRNKLYWGDNLQVMSHLLKEYRGKVDLVYLDPPFDSKADYKNRIRLRGESINSDLSSFEEKQYTDIWTNDSYLQFMYERLVLVRELLADHGLIFLHCDWHKSHYLRCILEELFGADNFVNEIIWQKCNSKNFTSKSLSNVHDTIFLYSKSRDHVFNEVFEELREEYVESAYRHKDEDGRRYRLLPLHAPGERKGPTGQPWRGAPPPAGAHWRFAPSTLDSMKSEGLIVESRTGVISYIKYLDQSKGSRIGTIWLDAKQLPSTENTNYPTQKPESILEKIIEIGSDKGGLVFDCFMGSGTTQAVSMKLGRRFIGADINLGSIQTATARLLKVAKESGPQQEKLLQVEDSVDPDFLGFEVYNVNHYDVFRNPDEARDTLIEALEVQRLDGNNIYDGEKDGRLVKILPINRIATKADLSELISGFDYKAFDRRQADSPNQPVEKLLLICMGHEADLAASLQSEVNYKLDIEVVDILRDKSELEFKRDSECKIQVFDGELVIEEFFPMNLLQKLSLQKENVEDWRELVESVMVDWNFDGAVLSPAEIDLPEKNELVGGKYRIPEGAGTIRVKITDLLSESLEMDVPNA